MPSPQHQSHGVVQCANSQHRSPLLPWFLLLPPCRSPCLSPFPYSPPLQLMPWPHVVGSYPGVRALVSCKDKARTCCKRRHAPVVLLMTDGCKSRSEGRCSERNPNAGAAFLEGFEILLARLGGMLGFRFRLKPTLTAHTCMGLLDACRNQEKLSTSSR